MYSGGSNVGNQKNPRFFNTNMITFALKCLIVLFCLNEKEKKNAQKNRKIQM